MGTRPIWMGASHSGKAPAYSSMRYDTMRSMVLMMARWIITGRGCVPSAAVYLRPNWLGRWKSSWTVE